MNDAWISEKHDNFTSILRYLQRMKKIIIEANKNKRRLSKDENKLSLIVIEEAKKLLLNEAKLERRKVRRKK